MRERESFASEVHALRGDRFAALDTEAYDADSELLADAQWEHDTSAPAGTTLYLPIALSSAVPAKVGVFLPRGLSPAGAIDVIVYLHGHIDPCTAASNRGKFEKSGIEAYWNAANFRFLRDEMDRHGVQAILVAPTLTKLFGSSGRPASQRGDLNKAGKFDFLLEQTFQQLRSQGHIPGSALVGRIVLCGHSAGGLPMQEILAARNTLNERVMECWGFECLYFGTAVWERWLEAHPDRHFRHYRRPDALLNDAKTKTQHRFVKAAQTLSRYPNFQDVSNGRSHCGIVGEAWSPAMAALSSGGGVSPARILNRIGSGVSALLAAAAAHAAAASIRGSAAAPARAPAPAAGDSGYTLTKWPLGTSRITLTTAGDAKKGTAVRIMAAPAAFMPIIIESARQLALKDGKTAVADALQPSTWFQRFTRISFLGRPMKDKQYMHVEFAKLLQQIEAALVRTYGGTPTTVGDVMLNGSKEGLSGSRQVSSTATYSMHMFGLAVDINYLGNPFISSKAQIKLLNDVLARAAQLTGTRQLEYAKGSSLDRIIEIDTALQQYFALARSTNLASLLSSAAAPWRSMSSAAAAQRIEDDIRKLGTALVRGGKRLDHFRTHGIFNFDRRFVEAMQQHGVDWGGSYGDMMHFDMRRTGVGKYIERARLNYAGSMKKLAAKYHTDKRYGDFSPSGDPIAG